MKAVLFAKYLMKKFETHPISPEVKVEALKEVFRHSVFLKGSETKRKKIMLKSSEYQYNKELNYPWDHYFGLSLLSYLQGKNVLDLGCFTGGRSVAWCERYKLGYLVGIDVNQLFIDAAKQFSKLKNTRADFRLGKGECLPFEKASFDAILSFDVFEHVQDVKQTLNECYRVLKAGGKLFLVFPSYFHPIEHHLSLVTKLPFIHYLFKGETLVKAYTVILEERGDKAFWYKRNNSNLESWERCNTINGTNLIQFRKFLKHKNWKIIFQSKKTIGSIGKNISNNRIFRFLSNFFYPFRSIPFLQDIILHRITYILEK